MSLKLKDKHLEDILGAVIVAGAHVMRFYGRDREKIVRKESISQVQTDADLASHKVLTKYLRGAFETHTIISEEGEREGRDNDHIWFIDPLDGTKYDFLGQTGQFSVMVGMAYKHEPVLGVVYQPTLQRAWYAMRGEGAWSKEFMHAKDSGRMQRPLHLRVHPQSSMRAARIIISRRHLPNEKGYQFAKALGVFGGVERVGSFGIKAAYIAEGRSDVYINWSRDVSEWDAVPGHIIVEEAQGKVTDLRGEKLEYGRRDSSKLPAGISLSNGDLHEKALRAYHNLPKEWNPRPDLHTNI